MEGKYEIVCDLSNGAIQGRRQGFDSGGDNFASKKKFWPSHFLASGGTKYCLDS